MHMRLRLSLRARVLVPLLVCVVALGALPSQGLLAATAPYPIDNSIAQFSTGTFQRTGLGALQKAVPGAQFADQAGAVQLGPIGLIKNWLPASFDLKKPLRQMGATTVGNRIFVIGGVATFPDQTTRPVSEVWSATVDQATGAFTTDWTSETALPAVQGSNSITNKVAEIRSTAVTSATLAGKTYIYVLGGNAPLTTASSINYSSYATRIGVIGADGHIANWLEGPPIPSTITTDPPGTGQQLGVQSGSALTRTVGGKTFVYLLGGMRRYSTINGFVEQGLQSVFYAQVGAFGQLYKPSSGGATLGWDKMTTADLPTPLWDAVAVTDHYEVSSIASHDPIYLIGGQTAPDSPAPAYNSFAYRAFLNSNGTLTWDTWKGSLPQPRNGLSGVTYHGSLYLVGGKPATQSDPDRGVLTSYVEDNLTLHQFNEQLPPGVQGGGTNFVKSDALACPRMYHATVVIPSNGSATTAGFIYVIGGRGSILCNDTQGTGSVIVGKIGSEDTTSTGYASDAWYFSKPYNVDSLGFTGAKVQSFGWASVIDRTKAPNSDIQLDFRVSSTNSCSNPTWSGWTPLDDPGAAAFRTLNGNAQNTAPAGNLAARCLQYRAKLLTDNYLVTPSLLNISITLFIPGSPDLKPKSLTAIRGPANSLAGLDILIQNVNTVEPTLPASFGTANANDSFYVDICIFKPGQAVSIPPLPWVNTTCSSAFAEILKSSLGAGKSFSVTQWWDIKDDKKLKGPVNLTSYFATPGTYKVVFAVDSYNFVPETSTGGEGNNISTVYTINVPSGIASRVMVPLVQR
jgi:hypothetical protein